MKKAIIISIGDELLSGKTLNTNASFIARKLTEIGVPVLQIYTISDSHDIIVNTLHHVCSNADFIFTTGGLGPTQDDITTSALSAFFECGMVSHLPAMEKIENFYKRLQKPMPASSARQAMVLENADILENPLGASPCQIINHKGSLYFFMPGVPEEMKAIMTDAIIPYLHNKGVKRGVYQRGLRTYGMGESDLQENLNLFSKRFPNINLAFLPGSGGVVLRMTLFDSSGEKADNMLDSAERFIHDCISECVIGDEETTLESLIAECLIHQRKTLSVAESCTGGLISHKLTSIPGSSIYYHCGLITYSNQAKMDLLGVPGSVLEKYGAVSEKTAMAMAERVREKGKTDIGLAVTGIAGPGGGSNEKPVGLLWIGYCDSKHHFAVKRMGFGNRKINQSRFADSALDVLRRMLQGMIIQT